MERSRTLHTSWRATRVATAPDEAWHVLASGRPGPHWYVDAPPLRFRGLLDRLLQGPGDRQPPPGRDLLEPGDRVGMWQVERCDGASRRRELSLRTRVRSPGEVLLDATVEPDRGGSRVGLTVTFHPDGLLGHAYLVTDLPARETVAELTFRHLLGDLNPARRPHR